MKQLYHRLSVPTGSTQFVHLIPGDFGHEKTPDPCGPGVFSWWLVLGYLSAVGVILVEVIIVQVSLDDCIIALAAAKAAGNLQLAKAEGEGNRTGYCLLAKVRQAGDCVYEDAPSLVPLNVAAESVP